MRPTSVLTAMAVVLALVTGCGVAGNGRGPLATALSAAPATAREASFTDWSRVREGELAAAVQQGMRDDTLTRSVIATQAGSWRDAFGFPPQRLAWELTARSERGSALVVGWGEELDTDAVEAGLRRAGFEPDGGQWVRSPDSALPAGLASVMVVVEIDVSTRVLRAADDPAVLRDDALLDRRAVREVVAALGATPRSLLLQDGPAACAAAGVSGRGAQVAEQGAQAARRAGGLAEPLWSARAVDGDAFTVALAFDSPSTAARQARVRERLTTGPFIGRSGRVEDVLTRPRFSADEVVAVLRFTRDPGGASLMSTTGPLLFAGC